MLRQPNGQNQPDIANIWEQLSSRENVTPEQAKNAMIRVLHELARRAGTELNRGNRDTQLKYGYSVSGIKQHREKQGQLHSFSFSLKKIKYPQERSTTITIYANGYQPPMISNPEDPTAHIAWGHQEEDQTEWLVRKIREQVVKFIEENQ